MNGYLYEEVLSEADLQRLRDFKNGICYDIFELLGAKKRYVNGRRGVLFAVWAPNAEYVNVVGNFNSWDRFATPMHKLEEFGVFIVFVENINEYELYKYAITDRKGYVTLKSDPYGVFFEKRPRNASIVFDIDKFSWNDGDFVQKRNREKDIRKKPMNIYEVHLGSWKKPVDEDGSFYNYRELAVMLTDYVKDMGYTHIELLPVMEHPFDGSWGYQVTGYYAPTSRFGTPEDFMFFIDYLHQNGIGVILDWVPAHFPKDDFALAGFDGTCLYEHFDKRRGEHPDWGTLIFNLERKEVSNFLISNALYWVEKYHIDGIRMDAVASMLYLDYGRKEGEWLPNRYGGRENLDSMEFLKHLNSIMAKRHKNVLMIAEESTAWPHVTGVVEKDDSLGFNLKWNMGWMNDFLKYMHQDPLFRKGCHGLLTFSMMYAYSEDFVLVLSHDEVVHGKGSLINKMPGEYEQKFSNLKLALSFMIGHPGKKLLFMGQDFAQFAEWNEQKSIETFLIDRFEMHSKFHDFCRDLFHLYSSEKPLFELDFEPKGFEWMSCRDADRSIVSFVRTDTKGNQLLFVCNFTPVVYQDFRQALPCDCKCKEILNSDDIKYGGTGLVNKGNISSERVPCDGREVSTQMVLPGLACCVFKITANK